MRVNLFLAVVMTLLHVNIVIESPAFLNLTQVIVENSGHLIPKNKADSASEL